MRTCCHPSRLTPSESQAKIGHCSTPKPYGLLDPGVFRAINHASGKCRTDYIVVFAMKLTGALMLAAAVGLLVYGVTSIRFGKRYHTAVDEEGKVKLLTETAHRLVFAYQMESVALVACVALYAFLGPVIPPAISYPLWLFVVLAVLASPPQAVTLALEDVRQKEEKGPVRPSQSRSLLVPVLLCIAVLVNLFVMELYMKIAFTWWCCKDGLAWNCKSRTEPCKFDVKVMFHTDTSIFVAWMMVVVTNGLLVAAFIWRNIQIGNNIHRIVVEDRIEVT